MKAAPFDHARATSIAEAIGLLAGNPGARVLAGGQSLGPMLNLRLAQPRLLVQVNRLPEMYGAAADEHGVTIGACVTHAAIADRLVPDTGANLLAGIAENIAYRAVRNRGTIGGSLCHADPAADWVTVLMALDAMVILQGPDGSRRLLVRDFIHGAFRTTLTTAEILVAIRVPRLADGARWGFAKACRKPGDFAHAMSAVLISDGHRRIVIGALDGKPVMLEGDRASVDGAAQALQALDPVRRHMQLAVLQRAFARAAA